MLVSNFMHRNTAIFNVMSFWTDLHHHGASFVNEKDVCDCQRHQNLNGTCTAPSEHLSSHRGYVRLGDRGLYQRCDKECKGGQVGRPNLVIRGTQRRFDTPMLRAGKVKK